MVYETPRLAPSKGNETTQFGRLVSTGLRGYRGSLAGVLCCLCCLLFPVSAKHAFAKGAVFKETLKFDLLTDGCLLLELKAVQDVLPIHKAQLLSYMRLLGVPLGPLVSFHEIRFIDGLSRLILPGANQP